MHMHINIYRCILIAKHVTTAIRVTVTMLPTKWVAMYDDPHKEEYAKDSPETSFTQLEAPLPPYRRLMYS